MLSKFELQPSVLDNKKEFIACLFINNLGFVIFQLDTFFQNFTNKNGWVRSIEKIFVDTFSKAKQTFFGIQCSSHFQNAAADTKTESNKKTERLQLYTLRFLSAIIVNYFTQHDK